MEKLPIYSPPYVGRIWLPVYVYKIPIYPIFYLLKGDYRYFCCSGDLFRGFSCTEGSFVGMPSFSGMPFCVVNTYHEKLRASMQVSSAALAKKLPINCKWQSPLNPNPQLYSERLHAPRLCILNPIHAI